MTYMLGLISSRTGPFLQTYLKIALYPPPPPPNQSTNFLILKHTARGRSGFPFPKLGFYFSDHEGLKNKISVFIFTLYFMLQMMTVLLLYKISSKGRQRYVQVIHIVHNNYRVIECTCTYSICVIYF